LKVCKIKTFMGRVLHMI